MEGQVHQVQAGRSAARYERLRVRSALNPLLWLCGIIALPATLAIAATGSTSITLQVLAAGPVVVALGIAVYFAVASPEKLQSEEFQVRMRSLDLIQQKGMTGAMIADALKIVDTPDLLIGAERSEDRA